MRFDRILEWRLGYAGLDEIDHVDACVAKKRA
jgi:hypothetical protein